jgi:hypothetical protein
MKNEYFLCNLYYLVVDEVNDHSNLNINLNLLDKPVKCFMYDIPN